MTRGPRRDDSIRRVLVTSREFQRLQRAVTLLAGVVVVSMLDQYEIIDVTIDNGALDQVQGLIQIAGLAWGLYLAVTRPPKT